MGSDAWLQLDVRVLEQLPKASAGDGPYKFTFGVRYYIEDFSVFNEYVSQKLYFYDAKTKLGTGELQCDGEVAIHLAALALQVLEGDHLSDSATRHHLDTAELLPDDVIVQYGSSLEKCAELVNKEYFTLKGMSEPSALLSYLSIIQKLPTYGVHYYDVKDLNDYAQILGITPTGIAVYDAMDKVKPRKAYAWSQLQNVSQKKKNRFELEVLDAAPPISPDKPFAGGGGGGGAGAADTSSTPGSSTRLVFYTQHSLLSNQMLQMVLFQHTHSIQMQKVRRRRAHTRHTPQGGGGGGGDLGSRTRSYSSASKQVLSPAQEVRIPAAAKGVEKMLSDRRFDSPLRVTLFSGNSDTLAEGGGGAGAGGGGGDGAEDPETVLVNLERRRQQLLSELSRKRKLLAQYEEERAAFGAPASELKLELPAVSGAGAGEFNKAVDDLTAVGDNDFE